MPDPTQTNWIESSDTEYDVEYIDKPRRLGDDQLIRASRDDRTAKKARGGSGSKGAKEPKAEVLLCRPSAFAFCCGS